MRAPEREVVSSSKSRSMAVADDLRAESAAVKGATPMAEEPEALAWKPPMPVSVMSNADEGGTPGGRGRKDAEGKRR